MIITLRELPLDDVVDSDQIVSHRCERNGPGCDLRKHQLGRGSIYTNTHLPSQPSPCPQIIGDTSRLPFQKLGARPSSRPLVVEVLGFNGGELTIVQDASQTEITEYRTMLSGDKHVPLVPMRQ